MTFDDAAIPTKAQRQWTALGSLRDPAREQATIDFYRYNSDLVAETINHFAKAVKEATRREKVVGVSVHRPGPRVITLPRTASVTDLDRGTGFGDNLRSFQTDFDERATRVFVLK